MFARVSPLVRKFSTSLARRNEPGGIPGGNLPFDISNKYKLTAIYVLFFGSGVSVPFLVVRHQMLK